MTASLFQLSSLDDLRRRASSVFTIWLWLHLPLILAVAWINQTNLIVSGLSAFFIAAIATWFCRMDAAGTTTRQVVAAAFVGMASLLVFASAGPWQIDLHMYYFAIFAVLAAYCDWRAILTAAALSFLGFGAQPGEPDWGRMVADGREHLRTAWWVVTFPGLAILFTVLAFNLVGDAARDIFDPRLRGE